MRLRRGALVDVDASDGKRSLYRVIVPRTSVTPYHDASEHWATMRRYDPARRMFGPPRPVQVSRVTRVYPPSNCPLELPSRPRVMMGRQA